MTENAAETETPAPRVPLQELVGTRLGDYQINRVLGYGSMGVVFEADHVQLGRRVALKALPPGLGATEKAIQRFLREAQAVAQLSHESIVPIYEIACQGTIHYYAMQFLDGEPLDRVIKRGPLDPRQAARLCCIAARAIHFAHQRGIIHRDIKPANLIVQGDGRVVLTDFGLARPEQGGGITDSGAMVGTPLYMSPEQIRAKRGEVDRRTDVYSLGATLYEMVSGKPPFPGESTQEILQAILEIEPRSSRIFNPTVPPDLDVVVMKTLEKEPKRRYQSALELAQDLERFLENEPILARRGSIVGRGWRRVKKHRAIAILSLVIAGVALGSSWTIKWQRDADQAARFRTAMADARAAFVDEGYLTAQTKFDEALRLQPSDLDARLGRARSLCFMGQEWERENELAKRETRPQLAAQFGSVDKLYANALADVRTVADAQPQNALALFYRGFLRWRSREKIERNAGVEDLALADDMGETDWDTQAELAKFRYGLAKDTRRAADQRGELLQQGLTNASRAVKLAADHVPALPARFVANAHQLRAEIYFTLYELGGNAQYLELAEADANRAVTTNQSDLRLQTFLGSVQSRRKDAANQAQKAASRSSARPDSRTTDLARGVLTLLAVAEKSEQSKALADLLQRGGELLAAGWQETDGIRADLMDRFVNPYLPKDQVVSEQARSEAASEADAAHRILQSGLDSGNLSDASRAEARAHLMTAVQKNPRNAQYLFDLAVVEQDMKELDAAHEHLEGATVIAPSNPLFFHQLAMVDESRKRPAEALEHARKTEELAPDGADFIADRARLALDAEAAEADPAKRSSLHAEAAEAVGRIEKLAPQHAQLEGLRTRLSAAPAAEAPARDG
jgi:Tfp pilus assembly protein PilF